MGLSGVLNIAKTALLSSQTAIQTTSHNIANVNTPGYTRQRVDIVSGEPVSGGGHLLGTGVKVNGIERVYDRFITLQIFDAKGKMGQYSSMKDALSRLEGIFNDSQGLGLSDVLSDFFNALQDVVNDPSSYPARTVLLGKAQTLTDRINNLDLRIREEISGVEREIKGEVDEINSLTSRIAELNGKIQVVEAGGKKANDLRDRRELLIKELSEKIDITALEGEDGEIDILTAGGNPLVSKRSSNALGVTVNQDNNNYYDITFRGNTITNNISSGKLKGLIDARDAYYQDALNRLNLLSASLTKEFNVIHSSGYGLDGSTGLDFFTPLSPAITQASSNTGSATSTVSIETLASLTLDDYEIRFTGSSTFNIVNTTEDTIVSSGNPYTSGANIDFEGIRVVITGSPNPGDVFKVSVTKDAAMNLGVSLTDPNRFAAAQSPDLPGDNSNALAMASLENTNVLSNGGATFHDFYTSLVSDIGIALKEASVRKNAQSLISDELERYRESVSGVSLDEEGINLIKYQHAYTAAAKVLTVVDEMLETLVSLR